MIEKLRNRSEVIISYILGIFFIILGLFILFNTGQIRNEEVSVQEDKIETIFDLISAFFLEVSNMLSAMIGGFPIIAGILIILFGLFMFKVGSWIKTTTKYDVPRSEEHTSELQSRFDLVCRLLLEKKNTII